MSQLALILNQVKWPELTGTMTQHGSSTSLGFNPESCISSFSSDRFILEGCVSVANRVQLYFKTSDVIDEDLKVGFFAT